MELNFHLHTPLIWNMTSAVIDEKVKESNPEYDTQLSSIRWHLSEGWLVGWFLHVCYESLLP